MPKPVIHPDNQDFGLVLNCAVRYTLGRRTYAPGAVIDFITPLIPYLDNKTLWCFDRDIAEQEPFGYGDPSIDEPKWMIFHNAVRAELKLRGEKTYDPETKRWQ